MSHDDEDYLTGFGKYPTKQYWEISCRLQGEGEGGVYSYMMHVCYTLILQNCFLLHHPPKGAKVKRVHGSL